MERRHFASSIVGLTLLAQLALASACDPGDAGDEPRAASAAIDVDPGTAVGVFVKMTGMFAKMGCESGDSPACKVAALVDPEWAAHREVMDKLNAMSAELDGIKTDVQGLQKTLEDLAIQLNTKIDDLELSVATVTLRDYIYTIEAAYADLTQAGRTDQASSGGAVDPRVLAGSILTNGLSTHPYDVPFQLDKLNAGIVTSLGLMASLDTRLQKMQTATPPADPVQAYRLLEDYFGHMLAVQAKGLLTIAAAYRYLEKNPDPTIVGALEHKTLDSYMSYWRQSCLALQVQQFLGLAEKIVARAADPDAAQYGLSSSAAFVLRRADVTAALALAGMAPAAQVKPLVVVHVLGEPDRVELLRARGGVTGPAGETYAVDAAVVGPDGTTAAVRGYGVRPYLQFPLHPEAAAGSLQHEGAIKGATKLVLMKVVLSSASVQVGAATPVLPVGELGAVPALAVSWVDGQGQPLPAGSTSGALLFGHATVILKGEAARRGLWTWSAGKVTSSSLSTAPVTQATGKTSFAQELGLKLEAHPTVDCYIDPDGKAGKIYGSAQRTNSLFAEYTYEGPGAAAATLKPRLDLAGDFTQTLAHGALLGSTSNTIALKQGTTSGTVALKAAGPATVGATGSAPWTAGSSVKIEVQLGSAASWKAYNGNECFKSTLDYSYNNLSHLTMNSLTVGLR
jgi:hypothetical protein